MTPDVYLSLLGRWVEDDVRAYICTYLEKRKEEESLLKLTRGTT